MKIVWKNNRKKWNSWKIRLMYIMVINKFLIQGTHKALGYHLNTIGILTKGK